MYKTLKKIVYQQTHIKINIEESDSDKQIQYLRKYGAYRNTGT